MLLAISVVYNDCAVDHLSGMFRPEMTMFHVKIQLLTMGAIVKIQLLTTGAMLKSNY